MFKRKIYDEILKWKNTPKHKPLIIKGLRQIGKTTIVKEFGKNNYDSVIFLDFRKDISLHAIFDGDFDINQITFAITLRKKDANAWLLFGDPSAKISFSKNSIASQNPSFFSIYPNPAKNFFMLQTENFTASTLEIYNFNGECLRKIQLSAPDETIDISTLPAGFYVLKSGSRTIVFQKE